jgi:hypothetical protein
MLRVSLLVAALAFAAPASAEWIAPEVRQFGDWSIACDNVKNCTAVSVSEEFAEKQKSSEADLASPKIWVKRRAGGLERLRVFIDLTVWDQARSVGPLTLRMLDQNDEPAGPVYRLKEIETGRYELAQADVAAFFAASRATSTVGTVLRNGELHGIATTNGMTAALLFMDEVQGRAKTVTAIYGKGPLPAARVPDARAMPTVSIVRAAGQIEGLPQNKPELIERYGFLCRPDAPGPARTVTALRLADGHTLYSFACSGGGDNPQTVWAVADPKGAFLDLKLPRPEQGRAPEDLVLPNSRFDPASGHLTALFRARKFGDCGWQRRWAWDGTAFAMIDSVEMPACIGLQLHQWLQTYRAVPE